MYVCMYVFMYVYIYVCVCMYACAANWVSVSTAAAFPGRSMFCLLNFKNTLWILGGLGSAPAQASSAVLNDVWVNNGTIG